MRRLPRDLPRQEVLIALETLEARIEKGRNEEKGRALTAPAFFIASEFCWPA
jgi:hypothetical protein